MVAGGVEGSSGRVERSTTVAPNCGSQLVDARALPREGFAPVQPNNQRDIQVIHFLLSSDPSSSQGASSLPVYLNGEIFGLCPGIEFVFRPLFKARQ